MQKVLTEKAIGISCDVDDTYMTIYRLEIRKKLIFFFINDEKDILYTIVFFM